MDFRRTLKRIMKVIFFIKFLAAGGGNTDHYYRRWIEGQGADIGRKIHDPVLADSQLPGLLIDISAMTICFHLL